MTAQDRLTEIEQLFAQRQAEPPKATKPRRRRGLLIILAILAALVLAVAGLGAYLVSSISSALTVLPEEDVFPAEAERPAVPATGDDTNILILGTDSRSGLGDTDELEDGGATGQRSDTMMLVNVPGDGSSVAVISIMRDSWVPIPGHGTAKINAAMSWGGIPLAVQTVESLLGQRIDHVAVVDFEGFADISTALGGVPVQSPVAFTSQNLAGYTFTEGENIVEGEQALAFVRERYAFADGDYQRVRNQRSFLEGAFQRLTAAGGRLDVVQLNAVLQAAASNLTIDAGVTIPWMLQLGNQIANVPADHVVSFTLPTIGTGTSADGQSIVIVDQELTQQLSDSLADGDVVRFATDNDLTGAAR